MRRTPAVLLSIVLFFVVALGSFAGSYSMFRSPETAIDSSYLMQFDDDPHAFYLQKAARDITFFIDGDINADSRLFTLEDKNGNEIRVSTEKVNEKLFKILPPASGYQAGKQYILTLHSGAIFSGEDLKEVRELTFSIDKEDVEQYTYLDSIKEINELSGLQIEEDIIVTDNLAINVGDVLIDKAKNEAYKVVEILDNGMAKIETPALDEVFADLQVYGEYTWDLNDLEWNDELEFTITENIRESSFLSSLLNVAYAADEQPERAAGVKVDFKKNDKNNTVELKIEITLAPGKNGLFGISKLQNQEVTIHLETEIGFKINANIDGPIWNPVFDLSVTNTNVFSWGVDFAFYSKEYKGETQAIDVMQNFTEYQNQVGELTKKLANTLRDEEFGEIRLFQWTMPVPAIPLLSFDAEVVLFSKLELAAEMTLGGSSSSRNTTGIIFKDYGFRTYSDEHKTKSPLSLSFKGKAGFKAGIMFRVTAKIISQKVAYVAVNPQTGIYLDLFATYPILTADDMSSSGSILGLYGYFEAGIYFSANFKAWVNLVFDKYEYEQKLIEKKAPLVTLGNKKIAVGVSSSRPSIRVFNNSIYAPDVIFEYYDVASGRIGLEALNVEDVKFSVNGQELEKNKKELLMPPAAASSFYVTAAYKNKGDNKTYSTIFKVILSGSEIEGRVSAYTSGSAYESIPNATVQLYGANDRKNLLGTTTTDANGKFSFNVSEGTYILKISAQGYKELESLQEIARDETKFTEHILLVDKSQSGNGVAGGRINNAIDGRNIEGVELRLRENWNNRTGAYFRNFSIRTDSSGLYKIENIPVGYYTIEATKEGFYTDYHNVIVHATDPQYDQNFSISPMFPENQIRIVLRWGEHPRDLDSHLIGLKPDGSGFNVYFGNMDYYWDRTEMANLDVDDTNSYGPETITILQPLNGWVYTVHDYTNRNSLNSDKMSYSGAYVTVFTGGKQAATFNIPVGEVGTYWTVFEYVNGNIRPINAVNNIKPTP